MQFGDHGKHWRAYEFALRPLRRKFEFGPGCIIGATDFMLRAPRRFRVLAAGQACRALRLQRPQFDTLATAMPEARCMPTCSVRMPRSFLTAMQRRPGAAASICSHVHASCGAHAHAGPSHFCHFCRPCSGVPALPPASARMCMRHAVPMRMQAPVTSAIAAGHAAAFLRCRQHLLACACVMRRPCACRPQSLLPILPAMQRRSCAAASICSCAVPLLLPTLAFPSTLSHKHTNLCGR
jgi:hypothetical protein